jgi:hypothetical protein
MLYNPMNLYLYCIPIILADVELWCFNIYDNYTRKTYLLHVNSPHSASKDEYNLE